MRILALTILLVLTVAVPSLSLAQIVSYEATFLLPDEFGFTRIKRLFPPERWLDDGSFFMECEVIDPIVCYGEDDAYRWNLEAFYGVPRFFVQWRVITDGPRSGIPAVSPASMVASAYSHVVLWVGCHWRLARQCWAAANTGSKLPVAPTKQAVTMH